MLLFAVNKLTYSQNMEGDVAERTANVKIKRYPRDSHIVEKRLVRFWVYGYSSITNSSSETTEDIYMLN